MVLLRAFGTRYAWRRLGDLWVAHPWLVYAELVHRGEPRALEAADLLREEYLEAMTVLLAEEADALREVHNICGHLHVDVVVIGAVAYRTWVQDEQRVTEDVDLVVGLDLSDLRPTDRSPARAWLASGPPAGTPLGFSQGRAHRSAARRGTRASRPAYWSGPAPRYG